MKFDARTNDFIAFTRTKPGVPWHLRQIYDATNGWVVEWRCEDRALALAPNQARKLARYLDGAFRAAFSKTPREKRLPDREAEILNWTAQFDAKAKDALHNQRNGIVPPMGTA